MSTQVELIFSKNQCWVDETSLAQLYACKTLAGIQSIVGLPDLHAGRQFPIGAVFLTKDWLHPYLIGSDIGCGMAFLQTELPHHKANLEQIAKQLSILDQVTPIEKLDPQDQLLKNANQLGTIGGGNHFAELQKIHEITNHALAEELNIDAKNLFLLVHSGSRSLGHDILSNYMAEFAHSPVLALSASGSQYLQAHNDAYCWAIKNRQYIREKIQSVLKVDMNCLLDISHNAIETMQIANQTYYLHRKGAAPANQGVIVIPGSRGSLTYLVKPIGNQERNLYSLAHGAGRKWSRGMAKEKLKHFTKESFYKNEFGGRIICGDNQLIYEEAPQAYKKIDQVIMSLVNLGLIEVIATLAPFLTYKVGKND